MRIYTIYVICAIYFLNIWIHLSKCSFAHTCARIFAYLFVSICNVIFSYLFPIHNICAGPDYATGYIRHLSAQFLMSQLIRGLPMALAVTSLQYLLLKAGTSWVFCRVSGDMAWMVWSSSMANGIRSTAGHFGSPSSYEIIRNHTKQPPVAPCGTFGVRLGAKPLIGASWWALERWLS